MPESSVTISGIRNCVRGPLSPLLANVLLDEVDKELERRGHCFARYVRIPLIVTDDSGIVTGHSGDRDRCHG